jgi:glycosyltransferase involved in cell wall biosynthesis
VPKRVVLFSPGHTEHGGAAARSRLLASALAQRGWDVRAVTRAGSLRGFRFDTSPNLKVLEIPGFGRRRLGAALFITMAVPIGIVWGIRASAFLAIRLSSPATAAAVCSFFLRRPYLALTTSSGGLSELAYVLSTRSAALRRWLLGRASFLVAQTPFAAAELEELVPPERIAVVSNPVATVEPTPLNGEPRAVYTGRLSAEKDLPRLLEAWRTIAKQLPHARLTLVGAGGTHRSVEQELKTTVASDPLLRGTVTFTGWVDDVGEHLRCADVYVFPSLEEGMSNALLEACAWRRVVVASDIPPNRAVLGDGYPLLFRAGDTSDLVAALIRALKDDSMRAEARRHITERVGDSSAAVITKYVEDLIHAASIP